MYVRATVYLPVQTWTDEGCSTSTQNVISTGGFVRKKRDQYDEYIGRNQGYYEEGACDIVSTRRATSASGYCKVTWPGDQSGWCSSNSSGACTDATTTNNGACWKNKNGRIYQCYYYVGYTRSQGQYKQGSCNGNWSRNNSDTGCGKRTQYCYSYSSTFYSETDRNNWKASLSEAGGYAKTITVYSYPQRVYINYEGNGATSICGDGNTASWDSGTNSYNSNTSIKYNLGNPVCNTDFKNGNMAIASNSNSTTYISVNGGNLKENEYYRIGYDFKGWALNKTNADNGKVDYNDKQYVTATNLNARGGDTITLYAVWEKHNYQVTYSYLCGSINNVTYQYGTGVTLDNLDTTSCESGSNTKFLGWYEDIGYTKKLGAIPTSYYKDITLYAKERQARYFNYQQGKWMYTTK